YGSPFALNHYHDAHVRIDGAWAASFFFHGFHATKPGDLDQMGARYRHKNRAWQYAGDFHVNGAGSVDADTANMRLAPRPGGTNRPSTMQRDLPADCGVLAPGEGIYAGEQHASCDGRTTLELSAAGVLALRHDGAVVWSVDTSVGASAVLADDGELDVFDADGELADSNESTTNPDAQLERHDDRLA